MDKSNEWWGPDLTLPREPDIDPIAFVKKGHIVLQNIETGRVISGGPFDINDVWGKNYPEGYRLVGIATDDSDANGIVRTATKYDSGLLIDLKLFRVEEPW